ncbi:hypothetical protein SCLCIDRAFT_1113375 [Scleroderma citrinum Foug A]|uniref:Uncharacterized protein n=1 Tax=Scleroderma citrinum Foug A TaxID=1036808 RepID=A0A0C3ARU3_9AGAM|nr:hypothetical protein SCLCIDRAFT_1113375 [Scleroderma citrinum Foug A]
MSIMSDLACGIPQWRSNLSLEAVHFWSRRFPLSGVLGETQCFRWVFLPHQMASRLPCLLKTSVLVLVLWRLIRRIRPKPRPLANIRGPSKEHWLKGNYHRIFQDGLQYNLHLAHTYGGALKIHAVLGVNISFCPFILMRDASSGGTAVHIRSSCIAAHRD